MSKQKSALVSRGELICPQFSFPVAVDSGIWFDWLEHNKSFRFEMEVFATVQTPTQTYSRPQTASFSACKERRSGGEFWYATRKVDGKLRRAYLGESKRLTSAKLEEIALQLHGNPNSRASEQQDTISPQSQELHNCVTDSTLALQIENEILKAEISRLEDELLAAAKDFHAQQKKLVDISTRFDWLSLHSKIADGKLQFIEMTILEEIAAVGNAVKTDSEITRNGKDKGAVVRAVNEMTDRLVDCVTRLSDFV